MLYTLILF